MAQIEHKLWIHFSDYPFAIQPYFLKFLAYAKVEDMAKVKEYLGGVDTVNEKYNRLRTFLATWEKREFGDLILDIDKELVSCYWEKEWTWLWNEIFGKYVEIMKIIEEDAAKIQKEYYWKDSNTSFSKQSYIKELLKRANDILEDISQILKAHPSLEQIKKVVKKYNKSLVQYWTLFSITEKDSIKMLEHVTRELWVKCVQLSWDKIDWKAKDDLWNLYESNYEDSPEKEKLLSYIKKWLEKDYGNPEADFHLFYLQDKCILTAKFIKEPDWKVYGWAFNAIDQLKFYKFWKFIFEKLLEKYDDYINHGHVLVKNAYLLRYYSQFGLEPDRDENWELIIEKHWDLEFYHIERKARFSKI